MAAAAGVSDRQRKDKIEGGGSTVCGLDVSGADAFAQFADLRSRLGNLLRDTAVGKFDQGLAAARQYCHGWLGNGGVFSSAGDP